MSSHLTIIGAGLAGSEAAWQAAEAGVPVVLYEMRPVRETPVHKTGNCAELVCSNSMGSNQDASAPFLLKQELRNLDSLVIRSADRHSVPAGKALAVDRNLFSEEITRTLEQHPNITLKHEEVVELPTGRQIARGGLEAHRPLAPAPCYEVADPRLGHQSGVEVVVPGEDDVHRVLPE